MKVLHIGTEKKWRGGENQLLYLLKYHHELGFESFVSYPQNDELEKRIKPYARYIRLPSTSPYDLRSILKLLKICQREKIDIINTHSGNAHTLAFFIKALECSCKLVVHRRVAFPIKNRWLTKKKYLSGKVDQFIAISKAIKNDLVSFGVPKEKVEVVKSAVDSKNYKGLIKKNFKEQISYEYQIPLNSLWIGIIGALTEEKNHETLFRAISKIKTKIEFNLLVIGSGEKEEKLRERVRDLAIDGKVFFLGFQSEMTKFFMGIDILAHPSLSEGLGTTVIEAALARNFIIASNVGGIPEIIKDKETGLLFNPLDEEEIKGCLETAIKDKHEKMIEKSFQFVESEFSVDSMVKGVTSVYKR